MDKELPKVMVVAINAWREDATSHTLMNIFSCWKPEQLSMIYTRADLPNTSVCSRFFQISENDVLKSIFNRSQETGREVYNTRKVEESKIEEEHRRYEKARKKHSYIMTMAREFVWLFGKWKSDALKKFIEGNKPDVLFVPIYPTVYMGWVQRYVYRIAKCPMVCYLADDNYSYNACKGILSFIHRFWLRNQVKYLSTHCKEMFVIVDKEKEETDKLFGTNSVILTKGIDFSNRKFIAKKPSNPIKFVYTGNLIIGRDKTLALLADLLNEMNKTEINATLEIYSPDLVDEKTMKRLNTGCSAHRGCVTRDEVMQIQKEADVVVFAEALEGKEINAARLSFSTKITDYLANGKCILAIGKQHIAPIDYFARNDAAIIATDKDSLCKQIDMIVNNPEVIEQYERKAYECARRNHNQEDINDRLIKTLCNAIAEES